jgi:hypothetical protein
VKSAIRGIVVFEIAVRIHRPLSHGGVDTVVRQGEDDAVARPAIRAVDVGIPITLVRGVEAFFQAVFANRQIGSDVNGGTSRVMTLSNSEPVETLAGCSFNCNFGDSGGGRMLASHLSNERFHIPLGAFKVNFDSLVAVEHPTGKGVGARQTVHKWAKAHALYHATHTN